MCAGYEDVLRGAVMVRKYRWKVRLELTSPDGETVNVVFEDELRTLQDCVNIVEEFCKRNFPAYVLEAVKFS